MITIRTNPYTKEDFLLVYDVLHKGLSHFCFNFAHNNEEDICNACKCRISCKEMQSAMHYILSKIYLLEAQSENEK